MSQKNPIKFLDSYTRDDKDIFFGREKETSELYERVSRSKAVLLYGLSGTGKTSLINCGLENRYEEGQRIFVYVRRGADINTSFRQAIIQKAETLIHPMARPASALETLYYDWLKPITVVFDQFEELFISGSYDEKQQLIDNVAEVMNVNHKVKFIFSLREEYLAHMDEFEEKIPIIFDNRYRLEKMRRSVLEEVIGKIVETGGAEMQDDTIPGKIIDNISDRKGLVELPYLQVYLDKLTRLMKKAGDTRQFTTKLVEQAGKLEDVLGDFLEEQITEIAKKTANKEAINYVLKQFITYDGTKKQLEFKEIKANKGSSEEDLRLILSKLADSRIIKLEDGIYELLHDSLARKIAEKRTAEELNIIDTIKTLKRYTEEYRKNQTLPNRKQLKSLQPNLHRIELSPDELELLRKGRQKIRIWTFIYSLGVGLIVIAALVFGYFYQQKQYRGFFDDGKQAQAKANYSEARLNYQRALDVIHFINKDSARILKQQCEFMIKQDTVYRKLIKKGDSLFSQGVTHYRAAFAEYYKAFGIGYDTNEAKDLIKSNAGVAATRYFDMAASEQRDGALNLALALISESYILSPSAKTEETIDEWLDDARNRKELKNAMTVLDSLDIYGPLEKKRGEYLKNKYRKRLDRLAP